jgi:hypothetical protein
VSNADFVEQYYERIAADPDYRARLLADPVAVVCAEQGTSSQATTVFVSVCPQPRTPFQPAVGPLTEPSPSTNW